VVIGAVAVGLLQRAISTARQEREAAAGVEVFD